MEGEIGKLGHFGGKLFCCFFLTFCMFSYFLPFFSFFFLFPLFILEGEFYSLNQNLFRKYMQKKKNSLLPSPYPGSSSPSPLHFTI